MLSTMAVFLATDRSTAGAYGVTTETGWINNCYWENLLQEGPQRPKAGSYELNTGCSTVKVNLKFGLYGSCSSYLYTGWYSDSSAIYVLGALGSEDCLGLHQMTSTSPVGTAGNLTYPS
ncbi:MAG: hypothetical protein ABFR89_04605 [Actinomycetota bacterium]